MAEVWPYRPLPDATEQLSWLTALHQTQSDEETWRLRATPRQSYAFSYRFRTEGFQEASYWFQANASLKWQVPIWPEASRGIAVDSADTELTVDMDAEYVAGGLAIVWASCASYSVVTVLARTATSITLTGAVGTSYASAWVMPLRTCICRSGLDTARIGRDTWGIGVTFEATDNPSLLELVPKLQVMFALDASSTMSDIETNGLSRWVNQQAALYDYLAFLENSGQAHDVRINIWTDETQAIERRDCDAADYAALRSFIDAVTTGVDGSDINDAFDGAFDSPAFFDGDGLQLMFYHADQFGGSGAAVAALRDMIPNLELTVLYLDWSANNAAAFGTALDVADSSGEGVHIDTSSGHLEQAYRVKSLGLSQINGRPYLKCGGVPLEAFGGGVSRDVVYLDNDLGAVEIEPLRTVWDVALEGNARYFTAAERYQFKQLLHALGGQDQLFYVPEYYLPIRASTTTTIDVPKVRQSASEWVGEYIEVAGVPLRVRSAGTAGSLHRLTFLAQGAAPTGSVWVLRQVRLVDDDVEIDHREGRWMDTKLAMVKR